MARRSSAGRPAHASLAKEPGRVPRRGRRKPSGPKPQTAPAQGRPALDYGAREEPTPARVEPLALHLSRAPRPAEPPPADPNVFSYTFTIWKSN